jgi:hypothetical protein
MWESKGMKIKAGCGTPYLLSRGLQPDQNVALHDPGPPTWGAGCFSLAEFRSAMAFVCSGRIIHHAKVRLGNPIHLDGNVVGLPMPEQGLR